MGEGHEHFGLLLRLVCQPRSKLLLTRREINKLQEADKLPGYTIVPTLIFIDQNGRAKVDIALCRGKKMYDKRQTLKEKEDRREMDRAIKHY